MNLSGALQEVRSNSGKNAQSYKKQKKNCSKKKLIEQTPGSETETGAGTLVGSMKTS